MPEPLRVVVADDHYLVREGIRQLLEVSGDVRVVAVAEDRDTLLAAVDGTAVDVVVTDIRMPPGHHLEGIEVAHRLREREDGPGVVVLSAHADDAYARELFRGGTRGLAYLLKDRVGDRAELMRAITAVASGGSVIDPLVVEAMVGRRRDAHTPLDDLTPREHDVLEKMATGLSNPAIAATLHLSVSAVEKHISAIFAKLGLVEETSTHRRVAAVLTLLGER
ncbi:MAG TPA: response regulator transcription factor [Marmoricola sp.]|nr:response regulator transcription factor [Marmoricola sp.]